MGGCANLLFGNIFAENCVPSGSLDPPLTMCTVPFHILCLNMSFLFSGQPGIGKTSSLAFLALTWTYEGGR